MIDSSVRLIESRIVMFVESREFEYIKRMSTFDKRIEEGLARVSEYENCYKIAGYNPLDYKIVCIGVWDLEKDEVKEVVVCDEYRIYGRSVVEDVSKYLREKVMGDI